MSLQAALNHLGYECFHSVTAFTPTPKECDLWVDAMERKYLKKEKLGKEDFDVLMPHCSAVSADVPAVVFAEELVDAYLEVKVILYERDVDKWFHSFSTGVIKDMWDPYYNFVAKLNPSFVGRLGKVHQTWARLWMGANNAKEHRAVAKKVYREHYDMMRRIVPKERLLEYEITDGWEPLCTFFNKPVPDIPFLVKIGSQVMSIDCMLMMIYMPTEAI